MQIGSEMATLQEKNPKMDPKKRFFLKNPPGFLAFETSSSNLTSNRPFWLKQIYRDIKFVLKRLPGRCGKGKKCGVYEIEMLRSRVLPHERGTDKTCGSCHLVLQ